MITLAESTEMQTTIRLFIIFTKITKVNSNLRFEYF